MTHILLALTLSLLSLPVITLERTRCLGECPIYKVTIFDDGKVIFEGQEFVKEKGKAEGQISKSELDGLLREFDRIDYFKLDDHYDSGSNCPQSWTDNPSAITSLVRNGKQKTIDHYLGCRGSSTLDQLEALEDKIDKVANTARWIK